ncbi:MAG: hypothetical protein HY887_06000 [Deltaproteobacteria bacterium]|nr:hypothetical protein [Deltaproteobacteria bacterium]
MDTYKIGPALAQAGKPVLLFEWKSGRTFIWREKRRLSEDYLGFLFKGNRLYVVNYVIIQGLNTEN